MIKLRGDYSDRLSQLQEKLSQLRCEADDAVELLRDLEEELDFSERAAALHRPAQARPSHP